MTHQQIVDFAAIWLSRSSHKGGLTFAGPCPIVVKEMYTSAEETPDVWGIHSGRTILIEVKVSKSDFKADADKPYRKTSSTGMGKYRWYATPMGLLKIEELPVKWGLVEFTETGKACVVKDPEMQEHDAENEVRFMQSLIRRLQEDKDLIFEGRKRG